MNMQRLLKSAGMILAGVIGLYQTAHAVGTSAGTSIDNQATLQYSVGGVAQTDVDSNVASFLVDNAVNVTVSEVGGALTQVAPGETSAMVTFNVANVGNAPQGYTFTADGNVASGQTLFGETDTFNVTVTGIMVDSNGNGVDDDTLVGGSTADLLSLAADDDVDVFVFATIPGTVASGDVSLVSLTAATNDDGTTTATTEDSGSADDPNAVDVVFNDAGGSDDGANDGMHSARNGYLVQSAQISVNKSSSTIRDPVNFDTNPKAMPGAHVQYSITIQNDDAATADATLTQITDALNANVAFDPDHIDGATGTAQSATGSGIRVQTGTAGCTGGNGANPRGIDAFFTTDDGDADGAGHDGSATGGTVAVDLSTVLPADANHAAGELEPCENVTITFNVVVQ